MAGIGHNSGDASAHPDVLNSMAQNQIRSIIERVERLIMERGEVNEQIKEVFAEAKGNGFDVTILRKVIQRRAKDPAKLAEEEAMVDLYEVATGDAAPFEPVAQKKRAAPEEAAPDDDSDLA
jgi:uncharacterized protein (UPF0335 family)